VKILAGRLSFLQDGKKPLQDDENFSREANKLTGYLIIK